MSVPHDIDISVQEGVRDSNQHFIVVSIILRIWMIKKKKKKSLSTKTKDSQY